MHRIMVIWLYTLSVAYHIEHLLRRSFHLLLGVAGVTVVLIILILGTGLALLYYNRLLFPAYWRGAANTPGDFMLVVVGDSVSQGVGASAPQRSLVGLLVTQIEKETGQSVRVLNLSQSGATTQDALTAQASKLVNLQTYADLVLLEIGANDMRHYTASNFAHDYEAILQTMPPGKTIITDVPVFSGHPNLTRRAKAANQDVYRLAKQYRLPVAPVYATIENKLSTTPWIWINASDLFHPNNRGHQLWYEAVWSVAQHKLHQAAPKE